jgi:hypothetical protein
VRSVDELTLSASAKVDTVRRLVWRGEPRAAGAAPGGQHDMDTAPAPMARDGTVQLRPMETRTFAIQFLWN